MYCVPPCFVGTKALDSSLKPNVVPMEFMVAENDSRPEL